MERDYMDRPTIVLIVRVVFVFVVMMALAFMAYGCSDEWFVDFDPNNFKQPTAQQEATAFGLALDCVRDRYRGRDFRDSVQVEVTYTAAIRRNEDLNICDAPDCAAQGVPGQACLLRDGRLAIAIPPQDEPCVPMRQKLRAGFAQSIALQHGIRESQLLECQGD